MNFLKKTQPGSYILPENQRRYFKSPIGKLLRDQSDILKEIQILKSDTSTQKIIAVGDVTTQLLIEQTLFPDLAIIDEYVQRKRIEISDLSNFFVLEKDNPAGSIRKDVWLDIQKILKNDENKTIIKINGEEDLLVLPAILEAPLHSKVLYGQPNEGLVVVSVTEETKRKITDLMLKMVKINED